MPTFGAQLIGEAEKTLDAILGCALDGTRLTEAQWVTLRLAEQVVADDGAALAAAVADRAHFADAELLVDQLSERGLLEAGRLTPDGRAICAATQAVIAELTDPVWRGLDPDDVAAAQRVLEEVVRRGRVVLGSRRA